LPSTDLFALIAALYYFPIALKELHPHMKTFSVEEANALVPMMIRLFAQIDRARGVMRRHATAVKHAAERADWNGGIPHGSRYAEALMQFLAAVETVHGVGVEIKDVESGLCDFPHWRDGRVVYLCWKRGEDRIEYWHDIDAGFRGRQPI
jgi:hypothetical protein